jgi:ABC-type multidrug transport system fused ATPase/permease subunit
MSTNHNPTRAPGVPTPPANGRANPAATATNGQLVRRMFRFLAPVKGTATLACLLIVAWVAVDISFARMTRTVLNRLKETLDTGTAVSEPFFQAIGHEPLHSIIVMIVVLALLVLLSNFITFLRTWLNSKFTMDMVFHMRAAVYDRLQRVGFAFYDEHTSGALINRALSDLQNVRTFLQMGLLTSIEIVAFVVGWIFGLVFINKWAALTALLPVPFWIWYILRFGKKMQPAQRASMKASDNLVTVLTENVAGVHVVKAFATEQTEIAKYNKAADTWFARVMDTVKLWRNFFPVIRGIASASHLTLFAVGAVLVVITAQLPDAKRVNVGDLLFFGAAMGAILSRLQQVNQISDQYQRAIVSARRFFEVLDAASTVPELPQPNDLPAGPGAVEFNFVSFGYDPEKPVVKDIAFDVPGGSIVALVGPTGSGKSTLMQLLARFYDPQRGQILIDGIDIRKVTLRSLRSSIGFVFQETFLFSDTVANNIRYGHPDASLGDVEAAARIAQAHDFILELPQGYDTMLGERGATLSGGQRQRLAIARAIISNPRILVLDDALAAVDPETEHLISRALELVMVDRTVFIIAHRLSTVKASDLVIVLEHGRITQAGTHKELLRQRGHYRHIAEVQLAYQEKEILAKAEKKAEQLAP